jgi:type IV pilus assembly protein PilM
MAIGLGVDIGTESIKAVQVKVSGNEITVTGALKIPRDSLVASKETAEDQESKGQDAVPATLGKDLARAGLRRTGCLGLTGRDIVLRYLTTPPMSPQKLRMFIDMQISDRVIPGKKDEGSQGITYDFRILNVPTGLKGDMVIMAAAAKNESLSNILSSCKAAGFSARRLTPSAFGLARAYQMTQEIPPKETMAVVEVGHAGLEIVLVSEDTIYFARNGPGGSRRFDAGLTKAFKWTGDRLREYKHNRVRLVADEAALRGPDEKEVQDALRDGADAIANGIRGAVTFCRTQAKLPRLDYRRAVICGGGARLKGLDAYLEAKTQRTVQLLKLGERVNFVDTQVARVFEGDVPDMMVALGLALIDADPECFHLELTPSSVKANRVFWGRTVYAAAAGVVFLGSLAIPYLNAQKSLSTANDKQVELTEKVTKSEDLKKEFQKRVEENRKLSQKREYYARQARLGPVYLALWDRLRTQAPKGIMFTQLNAKGQGVDAGLGEPVREIVVQGHYDPVELTKFERTLQQFFDKIKSIPGVEGVPKLNAAFDDKDLKKPVGNKGFEFEVQLSSSQKPILAPVAPAAPATPEAPGKAADNTTAGAK